jgi:hypothetical protein
MHAALPGQADRSRDDTTVRAVQGQTCPTGPAPSSGTTAIFTGGSAGRERAGAFEQPGPVRHVTTVRRPDRTTLDNPAAKALGAQQRALPAGPHSANTTVRARLQAAYDQPRPDGQAWTARTLAEAAGCGRSSAASFLQRQRPSTAEDAQ